MRVDRSTRAAYRPVPLALAPAAVCLAESLQLAGVCLPAAVFPLAAACPQAVCLQAG